jgi:hypothetical protein
LQRHYEIRDGQVHIPEVPGVGIEWDEKVVAAARPGWSKDERIIAVPHGHGATRLSRRKRVSAAKG